MSKLLHVLLCINRCKIINVLLLYAVMYVRYIHNLELSLKDYFVVFIPLLYAFVAHNLIRSWLSVYQMLIAKKKQKLPKNSSPNVDNLLSSVEQLLIISWSTVDHQLINCWSSIDQLLIISRSTVDHQLINCWSSIDQLLIISWSTVGIK